MRRRSTARSRNSGVKFRRTRAILIGGLVFGIGTTLTVASWNDSEFATGNFAASVFGVEGSSDGSVFTEHPSSDVAAALSFPAAGLSPGASRYAQFDIRTTGSTTVSGSITLESAGASGTLSPVLQYRTVLTGAGAECNPEAFAGTPTWVAGSSGTYVAGGTVPGATPTTVISAGGTQTLRYCFEVQVTPGASNSYQGTNGQLTWQFAAVSDE